MKVTREAAFSTFKFNWLHSFRSPQFGEASFTVDACMSKIESSLQIIRVCLKLGVTQGLQRRKLFHATHFDCFSGGYFYVSANLRKTFNNHDSFVVKFKTVLHDKLLLPPLA